MNSRRLLAMFIFLGVGTVFQPGCLVLEKDHNATVRDLERTKVLLANAEREQIRERNRLSNQLARCREGHKGLDKSCSAMEAELKYMEDQLASLNEAVAGAFGAGQPAITLAYRNLVDDGKVYLDGALSPLQEPVVELEPPALSKSKSDSVQSDSVSEVRPEAMTGSAEGVSEGDQLSLAASPTDPTEVTESTIKEAAETTQVASTSDEPLFNKQSSWQSSVTITTGGNGDWLRLAIPSSTLFDNGTVPLSQHGAELLVQLFPLLKPFATWQMELVAGPAQPHDRAIHHPEANQIKVSDSVNPDGTHPQGAKKPQSDLPPTGTEQPPSISRPEAIENRTALTALRLIAIANHMEKAGFQITAIRTITSPEAEAVPAESGALPQQPSVQDHSGGTSPSSMGGDLPQTGHVELWLRPNQLLSQMPKTRGKLNIESIETKAE